MNFLFFNLLVNSILSLFLGLLLVYFFIWFFRIEVGRWKLFFLSLPFLKIIYDFARGIPEKSVLFSGIDPYSLPPKHQFLTIGGGLDGWTPYLNTVLSVKALDGQMYHSSIGDYLLIWLYRSFGEPLPWIIVTIVLLISATLVLKRALQYFQFEHKRRKDRKQLTSFKTRIEGFRNVDIYISTHFSGTPFTGGILKPYICLPKDATEKLNSEELTAVIAHEMGHVRYYDLAVNIFILGLGDLFWFVPGYRWLSRKIDRLREIVADTDAVRSNVDPHHLASALLKLKEIPEPNNNFVMYSAFFREKSLLKERIERLIGNIKEKQPRFGWQILCFRYIASFVISIFVLNSVLGGNFT